MAKRLKHPEPNMMIFPLNLVSKKKRKNSISHWNLLQLLTIGGDHDLILLTYVKFGSLIFKLCTFGIVHANNYTYTG